jgi:hypothetical protein
MNRLLINMKNKVDIINGAIDQCKRLMKNETITKRENGTTRYELGEPSLGITESERSL